MNTKRTIPLLCCCILSILRLASAASFPDLELLHFTEEAYRVVRISSQDPLAKVYNEHRRSEEIEFTARNITPSERERISDAVLDVVRLFRAVGQQKDNHVRYRPSGTEYVVIHVSPPLVVTLSEGPENGYKAPKEIDRLGDVIKATVWSCRLTSEGRSRELLVRELGDILENLISIREAGSLRGNLVSPLWNLGIFHDEYLVDADASVRTAFILNTKRADPISRRKWIEKGLADDNSDVVFSSLLIIQSLPKEQRDDGLKEVVRKAASRFSTDAGSKLSRAFFPSFPIPTLANCLLKHWDLDDCCGPADCQN